MFSAAARAFCSFTAKNAFWVYKLTNKKFLLLTSHRNTKQMITKTKILIRITTQPKSKELFLLHFLQNESFWIGGISSCSPLLKGCLVDILQTLCVFFSFSFIQVCRETDALRHLDKEINLHENWGRRGRSKTNTSKGDVLLFLRAVYLLWPCKKTA